MPHLFGETTAVNDNDDDNFSCSSLVFTPEPSSREDNNKLNVYDDFHFQLANSESVHSPTDVRNVDVTNMNMNVPSYENYDFFNGDDDTVAELLKGISFDEKDNYNDLGATMKQEEFECKGELKFEGNHTGVSECISMEDNRGNRITSFAGPRSDNHISTGQETFAGPRSDNHISTGQETFSIKSMPAASLVVSAAASPLLPSNEQKGELQFPWKLHKVMEDAFALNFENIIWWVPTINGIKINDLELFKSEILPRYFNNTKYNSFVRQLNMWGFERQNASKGPLLQGSYLHPLFRKGRSELCYQMKRTKHRRGHSNNSVGSIINDLHSFSAPKVSSSRGSVSNQEFTEATGTVFIGSNDSANGLYHPQDHDVLFERGTIAMNHHGNKVFRSLVMGLKHEYQQCKTHKEKNDISLIVFNKIINQSPPGHFLKQNNDRQWYSVSKMEALNKIKQSLRDGMPTLTKEELQLHRI